MKGNIGPLKLKNPNDGNKNNQFWKMAEDFDIDNIIPKDE